MVKLTKRKGFNFFRSYYDVYNELETAEDKVLFLDALFDRQFLGIKPDLPKGMAKFAYISQTNSIDSQVKGYEDKLKSINKGVPNFDPWQGVKKNDLTPTQQEKEQVQEKEKEKEKLQLTIQDRETDFKKSLQPFLQQYGSDMLNDFFMYWTEKKPKGRKMLYEMQRTFDVKKRLIRWNKNNFNNKNNGKSITGNNSKPTLEELHQRHQQYLTD
jgi:hypothetical protein